VTAVRLRAYAIGATTALAVPVHLLGGGIGTLVRDPGPLPPARGDPTDALRAALRMLQLLARARLPWWRNTCLYRAVVECLVLRRYGVRSRVQLGVARPGEGSPISAHAWSTRGSADPSLQTLRSLVVLR
jgi:Transglutaminase-like superfamily